VKDAVDVPLVDFLSYLDELDPHENEPKINAVVRHCSEISWKEQKLNF
jgi:hypothetical protein